MKKALVLGAALMLFAGVASAQPYGIELDLDATTGNGPDFLPAVATQAVAVDVYVTGGGAALFSANLTLRHAGPGTWNGYTYGAPAGANWTNTAPQNQGGNDWLMQSTDFNFANPLAPPFLHGTASYTYDGPVGIVDVTVENPQGWFNTGFASGSSFSAGAVNGSFGTGITATEETSWSNVKDLFR